MQTISFKWISWAEVILPRKITLKESSLKAVEISLMKGPRTKQGMNENSLNLCGCERPQKVEGLKKKKAIKVKFRAALLLIDFFINLKAAN